MENGILHRYFINNNGRPIHKWLHYFDVYETHLSKFRGKAPLVMEIGVYEGGSLQMWSDYFGNDATILGIDTLPWCKDQEGGNIKIEIGDQSDTYFLNTVLQKHGRPDIIIDDGGHISADMKASFEFLYPRMKEEGIYIVEDTHANYWANFGPDTGYLNPNSFIEFSKAKVDELNAQLSGGLLEVTDFSKTTTGMHFYDSIVVFQKRPQPERRDFRTKGV